MKGQLVALRRVEGRVAELGDEALLAACAVGDAAALGALFDRHHASVRRFLARLEGTDARDLDDLVQSSFLEARRSAVSWQGRSAVTTWLFGIAANVVRHHVRGEVRRRAALRGLATTPCQPVPGPEGVAERRELLARLGTALAVLPHDLKVAFVMCDLEEVPGVEAARVLGIREGTLWRRLHEARKALRDALDGGPP